MEQRQSPALWEQRRYWQGDAIVEVAWWYEQQPLPAGPATPPGQVYKRDYCYRHGTAIYPDLACPLCGQRPRCARP